MEQNTDSPFRRWMDVAIAEARDGAAEGGIPIGSALVRAGELLGRGRNRRVQDGSAVFHAEISCLENAGRQRTYREAVLYSTLMPCFLCAGAVVQFGISKVVVGESVNFAGAGDFLRLQGVEVFDLNLLSCRTLLESFIEEHPDIWFEDIGAGS